MLSSAIIARSIGTGTPRGCTLLASVLTLCGFCSPCLAQQSRLGEPPIPGSFRVSTSLVQVDVLAVDSRTGLPSPDLKKEDFQVFDNGDEVPVAAFASGAKFDTRPVALWLVVICNSPEATVPQALRSGSFIGRERLFRTALDDLEKRDRVGVAHWCDNGEALLDLRPSEDRDTAIAVLERTLKPYRAPQASRVGELTLQNLVRLVIAEALLADPQQLPVLVFLHSDYTGMPPHELDSLTRDFLRTSGIVFGIKNDRWESSEEPMGQVDGLGFFANGERGRVLHYLAEVTGGHYFKVSESQYAAALANIITHLHFRYQLGFEPRNIDGKRHGVRVELTKEARRTHRAVDLRARSEYVPVADKRTSVH
jgi:hypothetical protein